MVAALFPCAVAPAAHAETASASGGVLNLVAGAGERNGPQITYVATDSSRPWPVPFYLVSDRGSGYQDHDVPDGTPVVFTPVAVAPGPGCYAPPAEWAPFLDSDYDINSSITSVCDALGIASINVDMGDHTDEWFGWVPPAGVSVTVHGGDGNDYFTTKGSESVYGDSGNDDMDAAGDGDFLYGGAGNDNLYTAGKLPGHGPDGHHLLDGGDGADAISGGGSSDVLRGGAGNDGISSVGGGADSVDCGTGTDTYQSDASDTVTACEIHQVVGGSRADTLHGTSGRDQLYGGAGGDRLYGGAGADILHGGRGSDMLNGGPGQDKLYGDAGNDVIRARDHTRDVIDCGSGHDVVYADKNDKVARNCEVVHRRR